MEPIDLLRARGHAVTYTVAVGMPFVYRQPEREELQMTKRISRRNGWRDFVFGALALVISVAPTGRGQTGPEPPKEDYVKSHYTKYEYRIPMRDGKKLFTSVYVPKDSSQAFPILMDRTPYSVGPYGVDQYKKQLGPSDEFEKSG